MFYHTPKKTVERKFSTPGNLAVRSDGPDVNSEERGLRHLAAFRIQFPDNFRLGANLTCSVATMYDPLLVQVRPLDEELELRATFKSRLSTRQRTINHRSDLVKELDVMGGAIEDFAATCRQVDCSRRTALLH